MKRFFVFLGLLFAFILLVLSPVEGSPITPLSLAQDTGWVIDDFSSHIVLEQSGKVDVAETIAVDFRNLDKHGIYRDIPYVYEGDGGEKTYTSIDVSKVLRDGKSEKYETSSSDGYTRIKIGDADRTISGKHTYEISYEVAGVLRSFSDHDELFWNVTGNGWDVHILKAEATVVSESGGIEKITCYQGYTGSTTNCLSNLENASKANFSVNGFLGSNEGLTVVVGYTKGLYPILTVERPKTFVERFTSWPSLVTLMYFIVFAVATVLFVWYRNGRDYLFNRKNVLDTPDGERPMPFGHHETVVVEYEPPEGLRPAEVGVLVDERADTLDVVSTIIDLAARGYLTITEVPKSWVFGKVDYLLKKKDKDPKELLAYEKKLLDELFDSKDEVKVSALKQTFYTHLAEVKQALYDRVVSEKFFPTNPEKVRGIYLTISIVLIILGFIIFMNSFARFIFIADLGAGIFISGLLFFIFSFSMSRRTGYGRELLRRVRGYKLFIDTAEKHRQKFFEKKNLFNEVLPYAIMFGVTDKFFQAMKDIGLSEKTLATGWYSGVHPFHYGTFSSSMNDFSNSMSSAIASTPKSSGFSSSGGSSGGGFGGGGGGSW